MRYSYSHRSSLRGNTLVVVIGTSAVIGVLGASLAVLINSRISQQGRSTNNADFIVLENSFSNAISDPFICTQALVGNSMVLAAGGVLQDPNLKIPLLDAPAPIKAASMIGKYKVMDTKLVLNGPSPLDSKVLEISQGLGASDPELNTWHGELQINVRATGETSNSTVTVPINLDFEKSGFTATLRSCYGDTSPAALCRQAGGIYKYGKITDLNNGARCEPFRMGKISIQGVVSDPTACRPPYVLAPIYRGKYLCQWSNPHYDTLSNSAVDPLPPGLKDVICGLDRDLTSDQFNDLITLYNTNDTNDPTGAIEDSIIARLDSQLSAADKELLVSLNGMFAPDQKEDVGTLLQAQRDGGGFDCNAAKWIGEIGDLVITPKVNNVALSWTAARGAAHYRIVAVHSATPPADCSANYYTIDTPSITLTRLLDGSGFFGGETYSFRVCAENIYAEVSQGLTDTKVVPYDPPPDPIGLAVTNITRSSMQLSWTTGGGPTSKFYIARVTGTVPPSSCANYFTMTTSTTYLDSGLASNVYSYRVCAANANPTPDVSSGITITRWLVPPDPIGPIATTSVTPTSMVLSWTSGGGSTASFRIARATGAVAPGNCNTPLATQLTTSFADSGLTPDTEYSYRVCAINGNQTIDISPGIVVTKRTPLNPPPDPTGLSSSSVTSSSITLVWTSSGGSTSSFQIARSTTSVPTDCSSPVGTVVAASGLTNSFIDGGLTPSTQYFYRVCAVNTNSPPEVSSGISIDATTAQ